MKDEIDGLPRPLTCPARCANAAGSFPAYTFPKNRTDLAALRVVVRRGFTHDLADMLIDDLKRQLPRLQKQPELRSTDASEQAFPPLKESV